MSKIMESIIAEAKKYGKHIVLAEGEESRIIQAAAIVAREKIAKVTLLGDERVIKAKSEDTDLSEVEIINPLTSEKAADYSKLLYDLRKEKGMTPEKADLLVKNPLYFGCLMVKAGDADGMVAGSINATGDVLRPALQLIKSRPGIKTVSSCFIMGLPEGSPYGDDGAMVYGDCAVIPDPTAEQLVDIAIASAESAKSIAKIKVPKVAMLSFSTKGSASHPNVAKVVAATEALKSRCGLCFDVDGELQLDAAIVPKVAAIKAPGSRVAGNANVLIFPDLQSGNIGYKLVQRFGNVEAIGPICQGLAKPVNDLSRGCSVGDVVGVVAITALQASVA